MEELSREQQDNAFEQLKGCDYESRYDLYLKRLDEWNQLKKELMTNRKGIPHDGLKEFFRIKKELNSDELSRDAYDSWPKEMPAEGGGELYSSSETYGILWRRDRLWQTDAPAQFANRFLRDAENAEDVVIEEATAREAAASEETSSEVDDEPPDDEDAPTSHVFQKREPLCITLATEGGMEVTFVPWHAPAASKTNALARKQDFRALMALCARLRKQKKLAVLLSDLNIDTAKYAEDDFIEHSKNAMRQSEFFAAVSESAPMRRHEHTTLVLTKVVGTEICDQALLVTNLAEQNNLPGRISSGREIAGLILEMAQSADNVVADASPIDGQDVDEDEDKDAIEEQTRIIQAHGASAFDKILPICRLTSTGKDMFRLEPCGDTVVPIVQTLAKIEAEGKLFPPEPISGGRFPSFAHLLERHHNGDDLETLRNSSYRNGTGAGSARNRILALVEDARKLSDHLPVLADFLIRVNDEELDRYKLWPRNQVRRAMDPVSHELDDLCKEYEEASDGAARAILLESLLSKLDKEKPYDFLGPAIRRRVQRAMARHEQPAVKAPEASTEDRPVVAGDAVKKRAENGETGRSKWGADFFQKKNLTTVRNHGGGDCLFRSASQLLYGDQLRFHEVRTAAVIGLRAMLSGRHRDQLDALLVWHKGRWGGMAAYRGEGEGAWAPYLAEMACPGVWGDLIMVCAISSAYNRRIKLYERSAANVQEHAIDFSNNGPEIAILNLNNAHFEAVLNADQAVPANAALSLSTDGPLPESAPDSKPASQEGSPIPAGAIYKWDVQKRWKIGDAESNPHCLFVFGENVRDKGGSEPSDGTQAIIRGVRNAIGVRTCMAPGAAEPDGAMRDVKADDDAAGTISPSNQAMIRADIDEIKRALEQGIYQTLVIPWDTRGSDPTRPAGTEGVHALGSGIARLPRNAPATFLELTRMIHELMAFAERELTAITIEYRETGLQRGITKDRLDTLYIYLDTDLRRNSNVAIALSDESVSLRGLPNARGVRVSMQPSGLDTDTGQLSDTNPAHKKMIDDDLAEIKSELAGGHYKRLSLPSQFKAEHASLCEQMTSLVRQAPAIAKHLQDGVRIVVEDSARLISAGPVLHHGAGPHDSVLSSAEQPPPAASRKRKGGDPADETGVHGFQAPARPVAEDKKSKKEASQ